VEGLDADVFIAAASPWSKRTDSSAGLRLPGNVTVDGLDLFALRELYNDATLVVVPVVDTDFQAGITTILEAMSMGLPVVCTRTRGQTDTVIEGETGRYVPPGDAAAVRAVIDELLADTDQARRLGAAGQRWVREHADIARYVARLAGVISGAGDVADPPPGVNSSTTIE
jgi:glycosyltransferase involved in cell wall biosynthesis